MARYALVIGISEYSGSLFNSLATPVNNANAIAQLLDQHGDFAQVRRLPFRRAAGQKDPGTVIRKPLTCNDLTRELQQFLQDAEGQDVLIYYSGHGFTLANPLSGTYDGFLAASDCQVELKKTVSATGAVVSDPAQTIVWQKNGISLYDLNALIDQHCFASLVVILDCCNAGAFLESKFVRRNITAFGYQSDYYLITACRSSSKAYEGEATSLLTAAVLKGLSQENASPRSGRISGDRLFDVIGDELQNSRQEPIRMGWGRMITLVRYELAVDRPEAAVPDFNPSNPYLGLKAFELEQADYFFGRDTAVRALLDRLSNNRFLAVIGPSGSGKSSLVKAGLLPELAQDRIPGSREWAVAIITPGQYPLQALHNALERHDTQRQPLVLVVDQFEELFTLCPNETEQRTFIKCLDEESNHPDKQTRVVIAMRGDFLDRCAKFQESADLINSAAPTTYVVIPLTEAKLVMELEEAITCPAGLHGVTFEPGLLPRILEDVINEPGAMPLLQYGLMQLWETCISPTGTGRCLTLAGYRAIEGVKGALQRWADQFYANLTPEEKTLVKEMVGELVKLGDDGEVTRRRASWERLRSIAPTSAQLDRIIGQLVYQRLLVVNQNTVEVAHEALLTESRLIHCWIEENRDSIRLHQRLEVYRREWEDHDRSDSYLLDAGRLAAIEDWLQTKQPHLMESDRELIEQSQRRRDRETQAQLEQERQLRELAEARQQEAEARELVEIEKKLEAEARVKAETEKASIEAEKTQLAVASARKLKKRAIGLGILLATSVGAFCLAFWQYRSAEQQSQLNDARRLVVLAEDALEEDPMQSLLLALEIAGRGFKTESSTVMWKALMNVREIIHLKGHTDNVSEGIFSKDGRYVLTTSEDGTARLWDLESSGESTVLRGHNIFLMHGEFSQDNQKILTIGYQEKALIWQRQDLTKPVVSLPVPEGKLKRGVFSQDGRKALTVGDGMAIVWTLDEAGKPIKQQAISNSTTDFVRGAFSPNNPDKILLVTKANQIQFINLQKPTENRTFTHEGYINFATFSLANPNLILSASDDNTARVWNVSRASNRPIAILQHEGHVNRARFDSKNPNRIITVSSDKTAKIWDISNLSNNLLPLYTLSGHRDILWDGTFSPHNSKLVLTTSGDGTARIWNLDNVANSIVLKGHQGHVFSGKFHPKRPNQILTTGQDNTARIWQIQPFENPQVLAGHQGAVNFATFDPNNISRVLTVSADLTARVWNLNQPGAFTALKGHQGQIYAGSFSPRNPNLVLTASADGTARIWDLKTQRVRSKLKHSQTVLQAQFSPDGHRIVTASYDTTAKLWSVDQSGIVKPIGNPLQHAGTVEYAAFSRQGDRVVTTSRDKTAKVWRGDGSGQLIATLTHNDLVIYAEFAPNNQNHVLTVSFDRTAKLWDISNSGQPREIAQFVGHEGGIRHANFSHDSKKILTVSRDGTARVWDVASQSFVELKGHRSSISYGMFHPSDNHLIVTASTDKTVRVWDVRDVEHPIVLSGHTNFVNSAIFSPATNSMQVLTASKDGTANVYTINSWKDIVSSAWKRTSRCLSPKEKQTYLLNLERSIPLKSLIAQFPNLIKQKPYPDCSY